MGEFVMGFLFANVNSRQVANTATESTLIPAGGGTLVVPASSLTPSNIIRITARGEWRTATIPPTLRIRVKLTAGSAVVVLDSTATTTASTTTIRSWTLEALMSVLNAGATGVIAARGDLRFNTTAIASVQWDVGGSTFVVDTTAANTIDVTAQWGTADVNNYILCDVCTVEISGA